MEEAVKCKHCGKIPDFKKYCFDNMCYYSFECGCKKTSLLRSYMMAENGWETEYFKTDPKKMPKIKTENGELII